MTFWSQRIHPVIFQQMGLLRMTVKLKNAQTPQSR
uniref:Uncharacterized protein n=1 Tax=Anguilla anguilla TaxID=7936 RepID=A0A0E9RGW0_ANGAN